MKTKGNLEQYFHDSIFTYFDLLRKYELLQFLLYINNKLRQKFHCADIASTKIGICFLF